MKKSLVIILILALGTIFNLKAGIFKLAKKTAAKELTEKVVDESTEKAIKIAAKKIGRERAEEVYREFGHEALEFATKHGDEGIKFVTKYGKKSVHIAMREGTDRILKLTGKYGKDAIEIAEKHPGTGILLIEQLGRDGIIIAKNGTTETVNKTLRYLPEMTEKGVRNKYIKAVTTQGESFFKKAGTVAINHTGKTVALGAGIYYLLNPEDFKEKIETIIKDGGEITETALVETADVAGNTIKKTMTTIAPSWVWNLIILATGITIIYGIWLKVNTLLSKIAGLFNYFRKEISKKQS